MNKNPFRNSSAFRLMALAFVGLTFVSAFVAGCVDDNNRTPTKAEGDAANVKRRAYVDSLNLPEATKEAMKAHLGGAPAPAGKRPGGPMDQGPPTR